VGQTVAVSVPQELGAGREVVAEPGLVAELGAAAPGVVAALEAVEEVLQLQQRLWCKLKPRTGRQAWAQYRSQRNRREDARIATAKAYAACAVAIELEFA
jgi:hypothetical protein